MTKELESISDSPEVERNAFPFTWWRCLGLLAAGAAIAALPFLKLAQRPYDKFVFSTGAFTIATAIMLGLFPEMRSTIKGRFAFRSNVRMAIAAALGFGFFILVIVLTSMARKNGWWR